VRSCRQLRMFLDEYSDIPYDTLAYTAGGSDFALLYMSQCILVRKHTCMLALGLLAGDECCYGQQLLCMLLALLLKHMA
jgi:hypothetical protein